MIATHRHAKERFTWLADTWDIAAFWQDFDQGLLTPDGDALHATSMGREFIQAYAEKILGLSRDREQNKDQVSLFIRLDFDRAKRLPPEALSSPILLLNVGRDAGMLRLNDEPQARHVLADGNHRIARAYLDGMASIPALIADKDLSARYLIDSPALRQERRRTRLARPA